MQLYNNTSSLPSLFIMKLKVKDIYNDDSKFGSGQYPIIEYNQFISMLNYSVPSHLNDFKRYLNNIDLYTYAQQVLINVPTPRTDMYVNTNYNEMQRDVTEYLSDQLYKLGYHEVSSETPVLKELTNYQ